MGWTPLPTVVTCVEALDYVVGTLWWILHLKAEFNLESLFLTVCCAKDSCYVDALGKFLQ